MRYQRVSAGDQYRLIAVDDGTPYDLTAVNPRLTSFGELAAAAAIANSGIDEVAGEIVADAPTLGRDSLADATLPVVPDEVTVVEV
ncbi:hypothetical protein EL22_13590 [Halostagnicola sp. A56]|uniref:hypothetical protein n=1 Tax=Halostagnicola sp. A56 TaxID=1495067 RepID=UPI00065F6AFF|nr:hypothetical protein [Halostagnicola sp. A56]KDE59993.2 hypothetical protein EL22_13590 [Halostagnicola sp. A56]